MVGIVGALFGGIIFSLTGWKPQALRLSRYVCFIVLIFCALKSISFSWRSGQHLALTFSHHYYVIAWALYFPQLDHTNLHIQSR